MLPSNHMEKIITILREVLAGTTDGKSGLDMWPGIDVETDPLIKEVWNELKVFAGDAKTRANDKEFEKYQRKSLQACLEMLEMKFNSQTEN